MGWKKRDVVGEMGSELALRGKERSVHAGGCFWVHMGKDMGDLKHTWVGNKAALFSTELSKTS